MSKYNSLSTLYGSLVPQNPVSKEVPVRVRPGHQSNNQFGLFVEDNVNILQGYATDAQKPFGVDPVIPAGAVGDEKADGAASGCRIGKPDDVAAVVMYPVSPAANMVTGTSLPVDGG